MKTSEKYRSIKGTILKETISNIYLDIGFNKKTVTIPKSWIERIESECVIMKTKEFALTIFKI